jgi:hypothetical protein
VRIRSQLSIGASCADVVTFVGRRESLFLPRMETIPMHRTMGTAVPADIGRRLRYLRKCAGLTPEQAGLETGLSARVIGDFERGYRVPRLAYLRVLAALYGIPIAELVEAEIIPGEVA